MKRAPSTALLILALGAMGSGCASTGYLADRGRDAADILTLTIGTGGGAKARIGPIQVAAVENADLVGLRAGSFFADGNGLVLNDEIYMPIPIHPIRRRSGRAWRRIDRRRRGMRRSLQATKFPATGELSREEQLEQRWITSRSKWTRLFGEEAFSHGVNSVAARRNKSTLAKSPAPVACIGATAPHYTQVEVVAGFAFTIRAGFNIGELLDFLLGWTGIDLYADDL